VTQLSLFSPADRKRAGRQLAAVRDLMSDGKWRTVEEIGRHVTGTPTALSARVRDLKNVLGLRREKRERSPGLWEHRLIPTEDGHA
jgi:hypothetical protein